MSKEVIKKGTEFRAVYGACQRINCRISGKSCLCGERIPERSQGYGDRGICGTIKEKIYELELVDRVYKCERVTARAIGIRRRVVVSLWIGTHFPDVGRDDIDIDNLPQANVDDCKKEVNMGKSLRSS